MVYIAYFKSTCYQNQHGLNVIVNKRSLHVKAYLWLSFVNDHGKKKWKISFKKTNSIIYM